MIARQCTALALMLLLSACVDRPLALNCGPHKLADFSEVVRPTPNGPFLRQLTVAPSALGAADHSIPLASSPPRPTRDLIALSGGGQWGAFGAGFLKAWAALPATDPKARPPLPDEVTGVSTGAIQATIVFLGPAYDDFLVSQYTIKKQSDLIQDHGNEFILGHASKGDQRRLVKYVTDALDGPGSDLIGKVAQDNSGRRLFVGTVDARSGQLLRVDMVKLARAFGPTERAARDRCYAAAIIASAAIPIEFRQVTVDGSVYMDGGVRQSAFADSETSKGITEGKKFDRVFLLFNEDLGPSAAPNLTPSILNEVPYLIRPMLDQVQQTSVENVGSLAMSYGAKAYYIRTDDASRACKDEPGTDYKKFSFFAPRFMACLIRQGENTAPSGLQGWRPIGRSTDIHE